MATPGPELRVIVPGFGPPHLTHKFSILESNLKRLNLLKETTLFESVSWWIYSYDTSPETTVSLQSLIQRTYKDTHGFLKGSLWARPGIVGEFLLDAGAPNTFPASIRHIMIVLDDVELNDNWTPVRWKNIFYDIDYHCLDVFSPLLSADSKCLFPYMRQRPHLGTDVVSLSSACELFCYILTRDAYERYYKELSPSHPWLWGIDLVLHKYLRFRVGLSNYVTMTHHYQSIPDTSEGCLNAFKAMDAYLESYGETQASLARQPAIFQDIYIYHRS